MIDDKSDFNKLVAERYNRHISQLAECVRVGLFDSIGEAKQAYQESSKEANTIAKKMVGRTVVIAKGSLVMTVGKKGFYYLKRKQKVCINHSTSGYCAEGNNPGKNPTVVWVGSGKYWCWTSVENVEQVVEMLE